MDEDVPAPAAGKGKEQQPLRRTAREGAGRRRAPAYAPDAPRAPTKARGKGNGRRRAKRTDEPEQPEEPDADADPADAYTPAERGWLARAPPEDRRRVAEAEAGARAAAGGAVPLRFRVLLMPGVDARVRALALRRVEQVRDTSPSDSEYHKTRAWVEALCALPVGRYRPLPVTAASPRGEVAAFLAGMRAGLDAGVYGHADAKGHVVRLVAQWVTNPAAKGLVIGVHGAMGTGKTTLVKRGIADALGLPFAFVPLGGAGDGAFLDGYGFTYEGSTWGRIADALMRAGCMNPVIFFDELDKVSDSSRGQEVVNVLVHLTDAGQNERFNDRHFAGVDLDLSRSLIVFSYNDEAAVSPVLRDRMVRVRTDGYALADKLAIAREFLVPEILREFAMAPGALAFDDAVVRHIVTALAEEEQGVRNLRRALHDVVSHLNLERLTAPGGAPADAVTAVTREHADRYVSSGRRAAGGGGGARAPPALMYT